MSKEIQIKKQPEKQVKKPDTRHKEKKKLNVIHRFIRELIAIAFWLYTFFKLFVFDIDLYIIGKVLPKYLWILNYRFFILIALIAAILLITKNKYVVLWTSYIIFYPFVLLFWKIPYFVFKQKSWVFAFALINAVISFSKSAKYNFITSAIFLVSLCVIISFSNPIILWTSIIALLAVLIFTYVHRFILIFKPSTIFQIHSKIISKFRQKGKKTFSLDKEIKNLPIEKMDNKQLEKWTTTLQSSILFNRLCYFISTKLRDYQNSRFNIIAYVSNLLLIVIITIVILTGINYGLYKIDPSLFKIGVEPSFFYFFFYSFNNLIMNYIPEIRPIAPLSQISWMIGGFFAFCLAALFMTLFITVRAEKYSSEINEIIQSIKREAELMEGFIQEEYKLPIDEAIKELEKMKASLIKAIYWFSKYID